MAVPPSSARRGASLDGVDNGFLASRRARITPQQAGLPVHGGTRRVPGLRREEVAMLAGVSVDYYIRLERGHLSGVSDGVLESLARALHLDEAERAHLFDLANPGPRRPAPAGAGVRPSLQRLLDAMTEAAAFVRNGRLDILAINRLGRALYCQHFDTPHRPVNLARFAFLDPRAAGFFARWEEAADTIVALLRTEAGRDPYDKGLSDLVGELSSRSEEFAGRWAAHNVFLHRTGVKRFRHPLVGELVLAYESMELSGEAGLTLTAYTAEVGTPSHHRLQLLTG